LRNKVDPGWIAGAQLRLTGFNAIAGQERHAAA
jgi:hypothetical protein